MPRRFRKRFYRGSKDKYSIEQKTFTAPLSTTVSQSRQAAIQVVPPSGTEGMRKVAHLTSSITCVGDIDTSSGGGQSVFWALVYLSLDPR